MIILRNLQRKVKLNKRYIQHCLDILLSRLRLQRAEIGILFVNDHRSRQLNLQYMNKDRPTDVLSFPMYNNEQELRKAMRESELQEHLPIGDIVINLHQAERQAREYGVSLEEETLRLIVHGVLHLLGYDHERSRKDKERMFRKQRELLNAIKKMA